MRGRWDAKSNPRDYEIARKLGSGLRDRKTLLGTLALRGNRKHVCVPRLEFEGSRLLLIIFGLTETIVFDNSDKTVKGAATI